MTVPAGDSGGDVLAPGAGDGSILLDAGRGEQGSEAAMGGGAPAGWS